MLVDLTSTEGIFSCYRWIASLVTLFPKDFCAKLNADSLVQNISSSHGFHLLRLITVTLSYFLCIYRVFVYRKYLSIYCACFTCASIIQIETYQTIKQIARNMHYFPVMYFPLVSQRQMEWFSWQQGSIWNSELHTQRQTCPDSDFLTCPFSLHFSLPSVPDFSFVSSHFLSLFLFLSSSRSFSLSVCLSLSLSLSLTPIFILFIFSANKGFHYLRWRTERFYLVTVVWHSNNGKREKREMPFMNAGSYEAYKRQSILAGSE